MSERPAKTNQSIPDQPQYTGGWKKPAVPGIWKPKAKQTGSGLSVPVLPKDKAVTPAHKGHWHLPQPEDTIFSASDTVEVKPQRIEAIESRPEDIILTLGGSEESSKTTTATTPAPEAAAPSEPLETTPETEPALKSDLAELEKGNA